jgi:hypothetical protein
MRGGKPAQDDQGGGADLLYRLENANCQIGGDPILLASALYG